MAARWLEMSQIFRVPAGEELLTWPQATRGFANPLGKVLNIVEQKLWARRDGDSDGGHLYIEESAANCTTCVSKCN